PWGRRAGARGRGGRLLSGDNSAWYTSLVTDADDHVGRPSAPPAEVTRGQVQAAAVNDRRAVHHRVGPRRGLRRKIEDPAPLPVRETDRVDDSLEVGGIDHLRRHSGPGEEGGAGVVGP